MTNEQNDLIPANAFATPVVSEDQNDELRPWLNLDQGKGDAADGGKWIYSGITFAKIRMVIITSRTFRRLYDRGFNSPGDGSVVCQSWDGKEAYGIATQGLLSDHRERLGLQECATCPMNKQFICRPCSAYLVMIKGTGLDGDEQDRWMPALLSVRGLSVNPTKKCLSSIRLQAGGHTVKDSEGNKHPAPVWMFEVEAKGIRNPKKNRDGYMPEFGTPKKLPNDEVLEIANFVGSHARDMWDADIEYHKEQAMKIGVVDAEGGADADADEATFDDQVPF